MKYMECWGSDKPFASLTEGTLAKNIMLTSWETIALSLLPSRPILFDCRSCMGWATCWGFTQEIQYRQKKHRGFHEALAVATTMCLIVTLLAACALPFGCLWVWLGLSAASGLVVVLGLWAWFCGRETVALVWAARELATAVVVIVTTAVSLAWLACDEAREPVHYTTETTVVSTTSSDNDDVTSPEPQWYDENGILESWHETDIDGGIGQGNGTWSEDALLPYQSPVQIWWWACLLSVGVLSTFPRMGTCMKVVVMGIIIFLHMYSFMQRSDTLVTYYFEHLYHRLPGVAWWVVAGVQMLVFVGILAILGGQGESRARTHHMWESCVAEEQEEAEITRSINKVLLQNILPEYLTHRFLVPSSGPQELYHERYSSVGVMFASIPNFKEFYKEYDMSKQGLECLRLLNEIICDYDKLLEKPKFSVVEKIKTIGSTYMVAAGLHPGQEETRDRTEHCVTQLVEFANALFAVLEAINKESFQCFKLRVGLAHGPLIAGVVGAQKPQYDIWGNTVNVASRMDTNGQMGRIQVTEETAMVLQAAGQACECRGPIPIKGKGTLVTYFVVKDSDPPPSELGKTTLSACHSFPGSSGASPTPELVGVQQVSRPPQDDNIPAKETSVTISATPNALETDQLQVAPCSLLQDDTAVDMPNGDHSSDLSEKIDVDMNKNATSCNSPSPAVIQVLDNSNQQTSSTESSGLLARTLSSSSDPTPNAALDPREAIFVNGGDGQMVHSNCEKGVEEHHFGSKRNRPLSEGALRDAAALDATERQLEPVASRHSAPLSSSVGFQNEWENNKISNPVIIRLKERNIRTHTQSCSLSPNGPKEDKECEANSTVVSPLLQQLEQNADTSDDERETSLFLPAHERQSYTCRSETERKSAKFDQIKCSPRERKVVLPNVCSGENVTTNSRRLNSYSSSSSNAVGSEGSRTGMLRSSESSAIYSSVREEDSGGKISLKSHILCDGAQLKKNGQAFV